MNELALFAGVGGGILGGKILGWRTLCAVEIESFCIERLMQRQNEGHIEPFPIWDDIRTFKGFAWRGHVDIISGGFPCQDISVAGKGAGIEGERSGLWSEMFRLVCEVRPRFVFVENSPTLTCRGLGRVLGDLASVGYDAEWDVFGAHHLGAPHKRDRIWILAYSNSEHGKTPSVFSKANSKSKKASSRKWTDVFYVNHGNNNIEFRDEDKPYICRGDNGFSEDVDRLKAIGNAQVPQVAAYAFQVLSERIGG